jgi:hypothetical protein
MQKSQTVLGSIPASSDTVESEGAADEAVLNKVLKKRENPYDKFLQLCGYILLLNHLRIFLS